MRVQRSENLAHVVPDSLARDTHGFGNLIRRRASGEQFEDFALARRQVSMNFRRNWMDADGDSEDGDEEGRPVQPGGADLALDTPAVGKERLDFVVGDQLSAKLAPELIVGEVAEFGG